MKIISIKVVFPEIEINTTPLEKIIIDSNSIIVLFDDIYENRYKIKAKPYQSVKITTIDCVSSQEYYNSFCYREGRFHRHILQLENSELLNELMRKSNGKQFLNDSKHYALPFQDILIEFLAYELKLERCDF